MFGRKQPRTLAEHVQKDIDEAEHNILYHHQEAEKHLASIDMYTARLERLRLHPTQQRTQEVKAATPAPVMLFGSQAAGMMNNPNAGINGLTAASAPRSLKDRVDNPLGDY